MGYRRLTQIDRYQIEALMATGASFRQISRQLGCVASTICREVRKGCDRRGVYRAAKAIKRTQELRVLRYSETHKIQGALEVHVRAEILLDRSPQQIAERLKQGRALPLVSHPTIYRYLRRDKASGGILYKHLRILRRQRKDRKSPRWRAKSYLPGRTFIDERPKIVLKRLRLGDYERDTVLGSRGGRVLLTIVDRRSRYTWLAILPDKLAELVHNATVQCLKSELVHTITNDNGTEFAWHRQTGKALNSKVYFSKAYRSWERGTNENTNGLLRQYFPKRKPIPNLDITDLRIIQSLLNTRPRKCLGYKTPSEVHKQLKSTAVALDA